MSDDLKGLDFNNHTIEPTTLEDVKEFFPKLAPFRMKAVTLRCEGKIYGIGGYLILPDGTKCMFLEAKEEHCRYVPRLLLKATRKFFQELKESGVRKLVAKLDPSREKAESFLKYLGFEKLAEVNGEVIYLWKSQDSGHYSRSLALSQDSQGP